EATTATIAGSLAGVAPASGGASATRGGGGGGGAGRRAGNAPAATPARVAVATTIHVRARDRIMDGAERIAGSATRRCPPYAGGRAAAPRGLREISAPSGPTAESSLVQGIRARRG